MRNHLYKILEQETNLTTKSIDLAIDRYFKKYPPKNKYVATIGEKNILISAKNKKQVFKVLRILNKEWTNISIKKIHESREYISSKNTCHISF